jgi:hypothetical protein
MNQNGADVDAGERRERKEEMAPRYETMGLISPPVCSSGQLSTNKGLTSNISAR